jgi:hypothetical protein
MHDGCQGSTGWQRVVWALPGDGVVSVRDAVGAQDVKLGAMSGTSACACLMLSMLIISAACIG